MLHLSKNSLVRGKVQIRRLDGAIKAMQWAAAVLTATALGRLTVRFYLLLQHMKPIDWSHWVCKLKKEF